MRNLSDITQGERSPDQGRASSPASFFEEAEQHERCGELAEAEAKYRYLLNEYPSEAAVLFRLARLLVARRELNEAETTLCRAVSAAPGEAAIHGLLGTVLQDLGRPTAAENSYRRALELDPDNPDDCYNFGTLLEEVEREDDALTMFQRAVSMHSAHAPALTRIGAILNRRGALGDALDSLDQAIAAEPGYFDAYYYRGWVLSALKRPSEALATLEHARVLRPDNFEVAIATANALRDAGAYDQALAAYWQLVEARPDNAAIHAEINQLAWLAGRHDLYLRSFRYAATKIGDQTELQLLEAAFHLRREGFPQAEQLLRRAYKSAPLRGDVAGMLARALSGQGRFDEGFRLFREAIAAEPLQMLHQQEFGFALLRAKRPHDALDIFKQAYAIKPSDQLILAGLALAYRELGDARYHQLVDFARYVRVYDIEPPRGQDGHTFDAALAAELDRLHAAKAEPIDQTLRGGTQTVGRLFDERSAALIHVRAGIEEALMDYIRNLPVDPMNPMAARRSDGFEFSGSWSCRLASGGYHHNHVHPKGWISSAYYARLPGDLTNAQSRSGWLKFGESNLCLGERDCPEHLVQPVVGRLVLFPSYYWHGTVPFDDRGDRLTIAFDAVPRTNR